MDLLPIQTEGKDYIQELDSNWFIYTRTGGCFGNGNILMAKRGHDDNTRMDVLRLADWFKSNDIKTSIVCLHRGRPWPYWWFSLSMKDSESILANMQRIRLIQGILQLKSLLLEILI